MHRLISGTHAVQIHRAFARSLTSSLMLPHLANFINGEFVPPLNSKYIDNINPATGDVLSYVPDSAAEDVQLAVDASKRAIANGWGANPLAERVEFCRAISAKIQEKAEILALAESKDTGKPIQLAKNMDIARSSANFDFFASFGSQFSSEMHAMDNGINYTSRSPVGVVGLITPWNLPLYLLTWKIAPALVMGNTIVAKPSEITPTTASLLCEILDEVGLPAGVVNIVHGTGPSCGQSIVEHDDIKAISFTGGTSTGSIVAAEASRRFKKLSLELGGKNPNIIFDDCDLDKAVDTTVRSSFTNSGQVCLCGSRIFVQSTIRDKFLQKFVERVEKLRIGCPENESTTVGALSSSQHLEKIESYIKLAKREGGTVVVGGKTPSLPPPYNNGSFFEPTIITGLSTSSRTAQEEIFGPIVTLHEFDTDEEAIESANNVKYGLSATIWTNNLQRAHIVANRVDSGIIWVNNWLMRDLRTPFGGMKASGVGKEGGKYSMEFFSNSKNIYIDLPGLNETRGASLSQSCDNDPKSTKSCDNDPKFTQSCENPSQNIQPTTKQEQENKTHGIHVRSAPKPVGAYPHARRVGDLLFLSGIGPRDPVTNQVPGGPIYNEDGEPLEYDIEAQTHAVIENVKTILQGSGATLQDVIDVQVFLVDMQRDFGGFNKVYGQTFSSIQATRTTCAIRALPTPIAVEFKVIASMKTKS